MYRHYRCIRPILHLVPFCVLCFVFFPFVSISKMCFVTSLSFSHLFLCLNLLFVFRFIIIFPLCSFVFIIFSYFVSLSFCHPVRPRFHYHFSTLFLCINSLFDFHFIIPLPFYERFNLPKLSKDYLLLISPSFSSIPQVCIASFPLSLTTRFSRVCYTFLCITSSIHSLHLFPSVLSFALLHI